MRRMTTLIAALALLVALGSGARAQQGPVVVELFTSQGCAACPPADALLETLAERDDVLPLALHVDYWDYIGWVDTFGRRAHSERQKTYARRMGRASVYTPQMIIAGMHDVKGSAAVQVMSYIQDHIGDPFPETAIDLSLTVEKPATLKITAHAATVLPFAAEVQVVRYRNHATVDIEAGENAGQTVTYRNIVTDWRMIGDWNGARPFRQELTVELPLEDEGIAVIVQEQGQGPVLAAARHE